jgi:hypothetical protein
MIMNNVHMDELECSWMLFILMDENESTWMHFIQEWQLELHELDEITYFDILF